MSSNADELKKFLVIGIGNPLRSDDGVGVYVAQDIEAKGLNGVEVWTTQQLQVEDLERMLEFDRVILVDASMTGPPLELRPVDPFKGQALSSSHHLSAEIFVGLASNIYHKELHMQVCSIQGNCFEAGDKISPEVLQRAQEAVELICHSLKV